MPINQSGRATPVQLMVKIAGRLRRASSRGATLIHPLDPPHNITPYALLVFPNLPVLFRSSIGQDRRRQRPDATSLSNFFLRDLSSQAFL